MNEKESMYDILNEVKNVDTGINNMLIPILKDSIQDSNKHNKRLFIIIIVLTVIILAMSLFFGFLIYKQNIKYQEFLSQFDFETTETVYQDTDDNSNINSGINFSR